MWWCEPIRKAASYTCFVSSYFHSAPFHWDTKNCQFQFPQEAWPLGYQYKRYFFRRWLHSFGLILLILQVAFIIFKTNQNGGSVKVEFNSADWDNPTTKTLTCILVTLQIVFNLHLHTLHANRSKIFFWANESFEFGKFINAQYDASHARTSLQLRDRLGLFVAGITFLSGILFPTGFVFGLHFVNPNKASLIGYWLLEPSNCSQTVWLHIKKIGVLIANMWIWNYGVGATIFVSNIVTNLSILSLRHALEVFEILESRTSIFAKTLIYRQIQLLAHLHNVIQRGNLLNPMLLGATMLASVGLTMAVKCMSSPELNLIQIGFSLLFTVDGNAAILFLIGGISVLYTASKRIVNKNLKDTLIIREERRLNMHKYNQKFWMSCQSLIKMQFGLDSFVDELTPIRCVNFSISLAVQLILLFEAK